LGTALSLGQRAEDVGRQERYRSEDIERQNRALKITIDQLRGAKTNALMERARAMLANNEKYLDAQDEGNQEKIAQLENIAYTSLFNQLPDEERRSEISPYAPRETDPSVMWDPVTLDRPPGVLGRAFGHAMRQAPQPFGGAVRAMGAGLTARRMGGAAREMGGDLSPGGGDLADLLARALTSRTGSRVLGAATRRSRELDSLSNF
jgi:TolA-binding protein